MGESKINLLDYHEDELTLQKVYELWDTFNLEMHYRIRKRIKSHKEKPFWAVKYYWVSGDGLLIGMYREGEDEPRKFMWKKLIDLRNVSMHTMPIIDDKPNYFWWFAVLPYPTYWKQVVGERFHKRGCSDGLSYLTAFELDYPYKANANWREMEEFLLLIKEKIYKYRRSGNTD